MGACGKGFANCRWVTSSSIYTRVQLLPDPRCLEFLWMESLTQESWTDSTEFSRILFKNCHGRSEFRFHFFFEGELGPKKVQKLEKRQKPPFPWQVKLQPMMLTASVNQWRCGCNSQKIFRSSNMFK
jgi:hypothetical protein